MGGLNSILIFGCGNMGGAMLDGWLAGGLDPQRFTVVDPIERAVPREIAQFREIPAEHAFDAVLIGVKPQLLDEVAPALEPALGPDTTALSLMAGVELATLKSRFPRAGGWVRVMPNLSAALGKSPIALAAEGLDDAQRDAVLDLMRPLGAPEWIGEAQFDLVTALAGSGPAFVYRFIDALAAGAEELGLPADQARRLALATVEGASALAARSEHDPGELARRVASPGGVTQAGLDTLDADDALARLVNATLGAARDRSAEMAAEARRKG
jgi:pyrroline-5-carboxylate reductase